MTPVSKRLAVFLAISVALNLLLVGAVIGRRLHRGPSGPPPPSSAEGMEPHMWRHGGLRKAFEGRKADAMGQRAALRGARSAVREALVKEPFDKAGLEAALAVLRAETGKNQELLHRVVVDAAAASNLEVRRELAESFEGEGRRRFRR